MSTYHFCLQSHSEFKMLNHVASIAPDLTKKTCNVRTASLLSHQLITSENDLHATGYPVKDSTSLSSTVSGIVRSERTITKVRRVHVVNLDPLLGRLLETLR